MLKLELIRAGRRYDLTNAIDYVLQAFDNLALPPISNLTEKGPYQVGATLVGTRIEARVIPIVVHANGCDEQGYWERRAEIAEALTPYDGTLILRLRRDGWVTRQLDCVYDGHLTLTSEERRQFGQLATFSLLAPDPIWYDPQIMAVAFALPGGGGAFVVPMPVPHFVGASILDEARIFTYVGTWKSEPVIRVYGPIDDLILDSLTTGETLDFAGVTLSSAQWVQIDCRNNTVVDQAGANRIAWLATNSDLGTFHIAAHPEAPGGVNAMRVRGENVDASTRINVSYYRRYAGI